MFGVIFRCNYNVVIFYKSHYQLIKQTHKILRKMYKNVKDIQVAHDLHMLVKVKYWFFFTTFLSLQSY